MSKLEEQIKVLLTVGDVGIYRTMDGDYGVSLDFYDHSYYLAHPAPTIKEAVQEMTDEWHVKSALRHPEWNEAAYNEKIEELSDSQRTSTPHPHNTNGARGRR